MIVRRRWLAGAGLVAVPVVAASLWVASRAISARGHLLAARGEVRALQSELVGADTGNADARLTAVRERTRAARRAMDDPLVRIATRVPFAGRSVAAVRRIAIAVDEVTGGVLPDVVAAAQALDPQRLRVRGDTVSIDSLREAAAPLARAHRRTEAVHARVAGVRTAAVLPAVSRARDELAAELDRLRSTLRDAAAAVAVAPELLGGDGSRRYFVAFQTPAEARGSGGLIGAFAILEADGGRLRLVRVGSNQELRPLPQPVGGMPADWVERYRRFSADSFWINANMSPHFPSTARVLAALYRASTGDEVHGVAAIDPVALSYVLAATGPARLPDGTELTAAGVADLLLRDAYARIPDAARRDAFFQEVARASFGRLTSGEGDAGALIDGLGRAVGEQRLLLGVLARKPQSLIESLPIGGAVPERPGPYLHAVVNNAAGTKLDYYLDRDVRYELVEQPGGRGEAQIEVTLTNRAPARGLPPYVVTRGDVAPGRPRPPHGSNRVHLSVFAGSGATLRSAAIRTGSGGFLPTAVEAQQERGHAVFAAFLELPPGEPVTLRLVVGEPVFAHRVTVGRQPLVRPQNVQVTVRDRARRSATFSLGDR